MKYGNAALLSELGKRQNQKYDEFWRIQDIRERLLKERPAERGLRTGPAGLEDHPAKRDFEATSSSLKSRRELCLKSKRGLKAS